MKYSLLIAQSGVLVAMLMASSGCVVTEPRDYYYDRDHHRYYHEHVWHQCGDGDERCR